jgi:outer membrane immunogenic protein
MQATTKTFVDGLIASFARVCRIILAAAAAVLTLSLDSAGAADAPPALKAPLPPVNNWTGCYVAAGGGYGMYNRDRTVVVDYTTGVGGGQNPIGIVTVAPPGTVLTPKETFGGHGWLLTGQFGCDLQFGRNWVVGGFVDGDWSGMRGNRSLFGSFAGEERLSSSWAVGGRIGWLPTPTLLAFFSAGYTQARFDEVDYVLGSTINTNINGQFVILGGPGANLQLLSQRYNGFFIGGGAEYAVGWLPGLFWKTEYRFSDFGTRSTPIRCPGCTAIVGGDLTGLVERNNVYTQTVRTALVWRFNFGGASLAR